MRGGRSHLGVRNTLAEGDMFGSSIRHRYCVMCIEYRILDVWIFNPHACACQCACVRIHARASPTTAAGPWSGCTGPTSGAPRDLCVCVCVCARARAHAPACVLLLLLRVCTSECARAGMYSRINASARARERARTYVYFGAARAPLPARAHARSSGRTAAHRDVQRRRTATCRGRAPRLL